MDFWQNLFRGGLLWGTEAADSAIGSARLFKDLGCRSVLLPGFGYGRNAGPFLDAGLELTGIEIAESAINQARRLGFTCTIHHGSVTEMPFDESMYDAVYCYALIHLLNKYERKRFLSACYKQLRPGGMMVFITGSTDMEIVGKGRRLSRNRFEIEKGLKAYFYNREAMEKEFLPFGLQELNRIDEPLKFLEGAEAMKMWSAFCKKSGSLEE